MSLRVMLSTVLMILTMTLSAGADGLQRLYVLDCGRNVGKDQSRWSPGVNEGKPIEFSDNCYLIRHDKGLLLWDTGVPDAVAGMADGMVVANGAITWPATTTCSATGA
jgi:N-acyl homoserine lactone hydrolase